ncbi:MAG: aspartyl protease family protein [Gammaproteobacteria bacterium]|nr:aspartyl protease family protein [Gammaproteobacteria bacterium]
MSCPGELAVVLPVTVEGQHWQALLDPGCSVTLVAKAVVGNFTVRRGNELQLETMNMQRLPTQGQLQLTSLRCGDIELGPVTAYVVPSLPFKVDIVLGLPLVLRHGCWIGKVANRVTIQWGAATAGAASAGAATAGAASAGAVTADAALASAVTGGTAPINHRDFVASFRGGHWTVRWKWKDGAKPRAALHRLNYKIAEKDQPEFDAEIAEWIDQGIRVRHDHNMHGEVQRFIPMMAVRQEKGCGSKVRPVFDYRLLNSTIESHPGGATPLCAARLRQWRQLGAKRAVLDLRKAYLQVFVDPDLWLHQAICWRGEVYLLTHLGFGLTCAPAIMTAIVEWVLAANPSIFKAASNYIDDIFVCEDLVSVDHVCSHFSAWGLVTKEPEHLGNTAVHVLGLSVDSQFCWSRDKQLPDINGEPLTCHQVHQILGEWVGHFPVVSWLRVASGFLQRCTASDDVAWDAPVSAATMCRLQDAAELLKNWGDPAKGDWLVDPAAPINVWVDASSLAVGVVLEVCGNVIEDAAWLRPRNDSAHINLGELDVVIHGINLALLWGRRPMVIITDSAAVFGWLRAVINCTHNVRTRVLCEILIRRRLDILREIIATVKLDVQVRLVPSADNLADRLTRVPAKWLRTDGVVGNTAATATAGVAVAGVATVGAAKVTLSDVKAIHNQCHFGVDKTLGLVKERFGRGVSRKVVKKVVSHCDRCVRVDPAVTFSWERGTVIALRVWQRWVSDITHVNGCLFLSVIDTASGFTMWRCLRNEAAQEVASHFHQLFAEFGPPESILTDKLTMPPFTAVMFCSVCCGIGKLSMSSCTYCPQGNGAVEWVHQTVKWSAARAGALVEDIVFWLNNSSEDGKISPYELVFCARSRKPGVSATRVKVDWALTPGLLGAAAQFTERVRNPFIIGDMVYL